MDNSKQFDIIEELFRQRDQGVNVDAGQQMQQDAQVYCCTDQAEREWQQLFAQHPQVIGLSADLPGDNRYYTVDDFAVPILATRDAQGVFHAFVNACRHRGARLCSEPRGISVGFSCPFHGWGYNNEGELKGVRREKDFGAVDKPCNGLLELPAIEHGGLLIVHPQLDGEINIDDLLGDLGTELLEFGLDTMVFQNDSSLDMALNWKLANDTFGETYHFAVLHKNTLGQLVYGDVTGYEEFGRNHRFVFMRRDGDKYLERPKASWRLLDHCTVLYYLFPNIQLIFTLVGVTLVRLYPDEGDPGRSFSRISHYQKPDVVAALAAAGKAEVDAAHAYDIGARSGNKLISPEVANEVFSSTIEQEDYAMGVQIQGVIESGHIQHLQFGRNEPALQHFHRCFDELMGGVARQGKG